MQMGHGYVPTTVRALTRSGWLAAADVAVGDETLGYNPTTQRTEWTRVTSVAQFGPMPMARLGNARWSVTCSPYQRWFVQNRQTKRDVGFRPMVDLNVNHRLLVAAPAATAGCASVSVDEAAIIGWILTDGNIYGDPHIPGSHVEILEVSIFQSKPDQVWNIRELLRGIPHTESVRQRDPRHLPAHRFRFRASYARDLLLRTGMYSGVAARAEHERFVLGLDPAQRGAFVTAVKRAEGTPVVYKGKELWRIPQVKGSKCDAFALAAYLDGHKPLVNDWNTKTPWNAQPCSMITYASPTVGVQSLTHDEAPRAAAWGVETELGSWTVGHDDRITLIGDISQET